MEGKVKLKAGDYIYYKTEPKKVWKLEGYTNGYYVIVRYFVTFCGTHRCETKAICSLDGFLPHTVKYRA